MAAKQFFLVIMLALSAITVANAQEPLPPQFFVTGMKLVKMCEQDLYGQCMTFVLGVNDTLTALMESALKLKKPYCLPEGVTTGQVALVTKKYLDGNPEKLNYSGVGLVMAALLEAFPCSSK